MILYPPQLEKQLTYDKFVEWTGPDMMVESEVEVQLPRFKMEEKYDLKDVLTSMGMVDAFDVALSDFSGETKTFDQLFKNTSSDFMYKVKKLTNTSEIRHTVLSKYKFV